MIKHSFLLVIFFLSFSAKAENWALRARENYDFLSFKGGIISEKYKGFSSTINLYREVPYYLSYGLSLTLPLGSIKADRKTSSLGEEIDLWQIGGDVKYFPRSDFKGFIRATVTYSLLKSDFLINDQSGMGAYVGLGWEIPIYKSFNLAPEIGYRRMELKNDLSANSVLVSIGLHFYSLNSASITN